MNYLMNGLERYGLGRRALVEDDFWSITHDEDVEIVWSRRNHPFYFTVPDDDLRVIVLPDRQRGLKLLFSMFHELGHHFKHGGDQPCVAFMGKSDSKYEAEADAFALLAMMPTIESIRDIHPEPFSFAKKLIRDRQRLYFYYGI